MKKRVVVISDTHCKHGQIAVPNGDILLHAGDFSSRGTREEYLDFLGWFSSLPHQHKIFIPGNHDIYCEKHELEARSRVPAGLHMLINDCATIEGLKIYGSPVTPLFYDWAFMQERGARIRRTWAQIPDDTDILITHGPPYGHGDLVPARPGYSARHAGCLELLNRLRVIKPKVHVFGHIHEGYGITRSDEISTLFINAATCNGNYQAVNKPVEFDIEVPK